MTNAVVENELDIPVHVNRDSRNGYLVLDFYEGRKDVDISKFVMRSVLEKDYKFVIKEDVIIKERGKPILVYLVLNDFHDKPIANELRKIKYQQTNRSRGLISYSRTFGYMPRVTMKRDFCTTTSLASESPLAHDMICNLGSHITKYYQKYCPDMFVFHNEKSKVIKDNWKIEGTPFSSGIINKNNALKYHFDTGNIKQVYSNMVCFKKNCEGGYLALPEFNIALEVANRSVTFFDGQDILHGVSPFSLKTYDGYRFTIVYYTLHQMWKCEPIDEEIARIRMRKREREIKRVKLMRGEIDSSYLKKQILKDTDNTLKSKEFQPYAGGEKESKDKE